jgi:hypothetical protein
MKRKRFTEEQAIGVLNEAGGRIVISSPVFSTTGKYGYDNHAPIEA